jgi:hypothetical protein
VSQRSVSLPGSGARAQPDITEPGDVVPDEADEEGGSDPGGRAVPTFTLAAAGVIAVAALLVAVARRRSSRSG